MLGSSLPVIYSAALEAPGRPSLKFSIKKSAEKLFGIAGNSRLATRFFGLQQLEEETTWWSS